MGEKGNVRRQRWCFRKENIWDSVILLMVSNHSHNFKKSSIFFGQDRNFVMTDDLPQTICTMLNYQNVVRTISIQTIFL